VQSLPAGFEIQAKLRELVDKQQALIDCLKNEKMECLFLAEKWKREHDATQKKIE